MLPFADFCVSFMSDSEGTQEVDGAGDGLGWCGVGVRHAEITGYLKDQRATGIPR
jgi:hypothetical protein